MDNARFLLLKWHFTVEFGQSVCPQISRVFVGNCQIAVPQQEVSLDGYMNTI